MLRYHLYITNASSIRYYRDKRPYGWQWFIRSIWNLLLGARFYRKTSQGKAPEIMGETTIEAKAPSREYTKPMTWLECTTVETYHHFEVLSKGKGSKHIIFHSMGNIDTHFILKDWDNEGESWGPKLTHKVQTMLQKVDWFQPTKPKGTAPLKWCLQLTK